MKHKFADDVNINVNLEIPTDDLKELADKVTESVIVIIAVSTVAHILRRIVK